MPKGKLTAKQKKKKKQDKRNNAKPGSPIG
jgi:hypothetical protein